MAPRGVGFWEPCDMGRKRKRVYAKGAQIQEIKNNNSKNINPNSNAYQ